MQNTNDSFYGQQDGETILFSVKSHPLVMMIALIKLYLGAAALWVAGMIINSQLPGLPINPTFYGFIGGIIIAILGTIAIKAMEEKSSSYITDRRIVRFQAHNPFATSTRSLGWDQAVKVKTFPPNFLLKILMIGNVIVHSKSTIVSSDTPQTENYISNDDLELEGVYYYKDLGNYIDKIIYLYNREPEKLKTIQSFVPKPKGQRY